MSFPQVEILRVESYGVSLPDLDEWEHYTNLKEAHLRRLEGSSMKEAFQVLKGCTNLRRLTLGNRQKIFVPSSKELCDFIMKLKNLTFLHIIYEDSSVNCKHLKSLVDEVKAFVLPRRPNFKFYVCCCYEFYTTRVPSEFCFSLIFTLQVQRNE